MSEGPPLRVTAEGVEAEPVRTGRRHLDMIVAGAAIFISCVSLGVAVKHGMIMQNLVAASSWPLLQYTTGNIDDETRKPSIGMNVENVGVGPAVVKQFSVFYKGRRYDSADEFLVGCCGWVRPRRGSAKGVEINQRTAFVNRSVIRANDSRLYLGLDLSPKSREVWSRLNQARFHMKFDICYCSVLGECWRSDLTGIDPRSVDECPIDMANSAAGRG